MLSGTLVDVLCGQPAQVYGCASRRRRRWNTAGGGEVAPRASGGRAQGRRQPASRPHARSGATGAAPSANSGRPSASVLPSTAGAARRGRAAAELLLDHRALSSMTGICSSPGELAHAGRLDRVREAQLDRRTPAAAGRPADLQPPQHFQEVVVRLAHGDDATRATGARMSRRSMLFTRVRGRHRSQLACARCSMASEGRSGQR